MTIATMQSHEQLADDGLVSLTLVGIRYTGHRSAIPPSQYQQKGAWPGSSPLQGGEILDTNEDGRVIERAPGPIQLGLVPDWTDEDVEDRTVAALETDPTVEVVYDPATLAGALLRRNSLPSEVFSNGYNARLREAVFDTLGLDDVGASNDKAYREQLRRVAGIDKEDDDHAETVDTSIEGEYRRNYRRAALRDAALALAPTVDADAPDTNAGKVTFAQWLAEHVEGRLAGKALDFAADGVNDVHQSLVDAGFITADTDDAGGAETVDTWADWNEDDWLDMDYTDRVADVRDGKVDDHLDAIEACERSKNVEEAVENRRATLEN
jgi:uncharacterized protein YciU (UPF0263 family)